MSLSDLACRHAVLKLKPYKLFDFDGLYLFVLPSGSKYWRYNYKLFGKAKTLAIGVYPQTSLLDARKKRDNAKEEIKAGIDPSLAKITAKRLAGYNADQTLEVVARESA